MLKIRYLVKRASVFPFLSVFVFSAVLICKKILSCSNETDFQEVCSLSLFNKTCYKAQKFHGNICIQKCTEPEVRAFHTALNFVC